MLCLDASVVCICMTTGCILCTAADVDDELMEQESTTKKKCATEKKEVAVVLQEKTRIVVFDSFDLHLVVWGSPLLARGGIAP